jgi:nitrous oxidase accessory protein NosD
VRQDRVIAGAVGCCVVLAIALAVGPASARKGKREIEVRPGSNAIAKALERAQDGDVLRIHRGRYEEPVVVEERVKLVGVGRRRPVIAAGCSTRTTIEVLGDGVRLKSLKVIGADTATEVDFSGVTGGRAKDLVVRDTCDAEYGSTCSPPGRPRSRTAAPPASTTPASTSARSQARPTASSASRAASPTAT